MNILIFCSHEAALLEYLNLFAKQTLVKPIFCLSYKSNSIDLLDENNFEYVQIVSEKDGAANKKYQFIKAFIDNTLLGCSLQTFILFNFLKSKFKRMIEVKSDQIVKLIEAKFISAVVIQNDRSAGIEAAAIRAARQQGLKVFVLPFAYSADYKSSYKLRQNKIYDFTYRQPKQAVYRDDELGIKSFFRPYESQGLEELGLLPFNPWVIGGSGFASVLLDSERELNRLISLGGDKKNYLVTGLASHDDIYTAWTKAKNELRDKKIVTVALPQYWEHGLASKEAHFKFLDGMLESLSALDAYIVISLHPKMNLADYEYMINKFGVEISKKPLLNIIANTDVLVSTFSSTVAWALMCQKNVVIVDHVGLGYKDFYSEFEIPVCTSNIKLHDLTKNILDGQLGLNSYLLPLIGTLSPFDGKCRQRILNNFIL